MKDKELLEDCLHYLTIYYLLHQSPSEKLSDLLIRLENKIK